MPTLLDALRTHLIAQGIVRAPDVAGPGARPWLPPAWRHPDEGAIGPGDAGEQGKGTSADDGLVVSLMHAPGLAPTPGTEERRQDGVDIVLRSRSVPAVMAIEAQLRAELVGVYPGGKTDWTMGGLYVIQSQQWRPLAPISTTAATGPGAANAVFTFSVGYLFETRVA